MKRKKEEEPKQTVFEGYGDPSCTVRRWGPSAPSAGNGQVVVERWRVTVEKIEEPVEVIQDRIRALWRKSANHHEWTPLQRAAKKVGLVLNHDELGIEKEPTP